MPALDNPKHERFAQARAKGVAASQAYVDAGFAYNEGNASRLNGNEKVAARVAELTERAAHRAEVSKAWVMERLMKNAQMCLGEAPLVIPAPADVQGAKPTEEYRRDAAAANQALQLLGKELGMFVDRSISAMTTMEELLDQLDTNPGPAAGEPEATAV